MFLSVCVITIFAGALSAGGGLDYAKWVKEAEKGNSEKQYLSGFAFYKGLGGAKRDYKKAYQWFRESAKNNNAAACVMLGDMYKLGHFVTANDKKAFDWYLKAARLENAEGMEKLGDMYLSSSKLGANCFEAAKWYEKAALSSVTSEPSVKLARLYYLGGEHFEKNEEKALKWFTKAFEMGDSDAAHYISGIYEDKGDYSKAGEWLIKGAEKGGTVAMFYLAKAYVQAEEYSGKNIMQFNPMQAYVWLSVLTKKEYQPRFEELFKNVSAKLSKSEMKEADKLAAPLILKLVGNEEIKWTKNARSNPGKLN